MSNQVTKQESADTAKSDSTAKSNTNTYSCGQIVLLYGGLAVIAALYAIGFWWSKSNWPEVTTLIAKVCAAALVACSALTKMYKDDAQDQLDSMDSYDQKHSKEASSLQNNKKWLRILEGLSIVAAFVAAILAID